MCVGYTLLCVRWCLQSVAPEEAALDEEHTRCLGVAAAAFEDVAVGEERIRSAHKQKYIEGCTAR
jgi:hypothetical protein